MRSLLRDDVIIITSPYPQPANKTISPITAPQKKEARISPKYKERTCRQQKGLFVLMENVTIYQPKRRRRKNHITWKILRKTVKKSQNSPWNWYFIERDGFTPIKIVWDAPNQKIHQYFLLIKQNSFLWTNRIQEIVPDDNPELFATEAQEHSWFGKNGELKARAFNPCQRKLGFSEIKNSKVATTQ